MEWSGVAPCFLCFVLGHPMSSLSTRRRLMHHHQRNSSVAGSFITMFCLPSRSQHRSHRDYFMRRCGRGCLIRSPCHASAYQMLSHRGLTSSLAPPIAIIYDRSAQRADAKMPLRKVCINVGQVNKMIRSRICPPHSTGSLNY